MTYRERMEQETARRCKYDFQYAKAVSMMEQLGELSRRERTPDQKKAMIEARKYRCNTEHQMFREMLEKDHEMQDHPKKYTVFESAWEYGHAGGYDEVANYYGDLAELVK